MADYDIHRDIDGDTEDDPVVALLERTLTARAASASAPLDLAFRARARRRRRAALQWTVTGAAAVGVAAAIAVPMALAGGAADPVAAVDIAEPSEAPAPPVYSGLSPVEPADEGWRWETYRGVELQVPADWHTGGTHQPCGWAYEDGTSVPYVSRPGGVIAAVGCGPQPVERWVPYVEFGGFKPGLEELEAGWVRQTIQVGEVDVTVQADDADLLQRIVASARPVAEVDAVGCSVVHSTTESLDARPTTGALDPAQAGPDAAVCQYALDESTGANELTGSSRLSADEVREFVDAVVAAPVGGGPDSPAGCVPDRRRGDVALVIRLPTTDGLREVVVWYAAGCGNGADDGVTLRALTADLLQPLFGGAVQPNHFSMAVAPLMPGWPR